MPKYLLLSFVALIFIVSGCSQHRASASKGEGEKSRFFSRQLGKDFICPAPYKTYSAENLSDAIEDSEKFIEAGFVALDKANCYLKGHRDDEFLVELYTLNDKQVAKSLFEQENESRGNCQFGNICQQGVGFIFFTKKEYYLKIISYFPQRAKAAHLKSLARAMLEKIEKN